jgi:hypothetical protein
MPRFLRWSSYGLRTKGLIVVGLPVVPLAVFWAIAITGYMHADQPANTIGLSLVVQANVARVLSDLLDAFDNLFRPPPKLVPIPIRRPR